MNRASPVFTEYEHQVIRQIAAHKASPGKVQRILESVGKPFGKLLHVGRDSRIRALRGISDRVQGWMEEGLIKTFQVANRITSPETVARRFEAEGVDIADIASLRYLPLSTLDRVADSFRMRGSILLGLEGALLGGATTLAESIPGAQLAIPSLVLTDITTSMTLLSRQTCHIATTYGYSSKLPEHLPHMMAAMAPQTETGDEGYLALKTAVITSIRESGQFLSRTGGIMIDRQLLEREAPQMVRLVAYVADRLGVVLTEKQLGILVPIAGAVLNGSINVAFQQLGHQTSKDYFRRLILEDRYGDEIVTYAIAQEISNIERRTGR